MATKETSERVQKLVNLAADKAATDAEASTAALQAVRLMKEEGLAVVPSDVVEQMKKTIGEARLAVQQAESRAQNKMLMGGVLGLLASKFIKI